ncbi:hypothetical protein AB395_00006726 (plasmid) [Sinorhizobium fredii CCBAU 45436]|nr:hypothetical protein AB395_00006726 [Sinorhizobium fredii CCBAU 45436]CCE99154.1 hypothetical protein SFHH103_04681 [Sinorhizobium fredii HH103]CEO91839.1 hypothetical protein SFHH103_psfHH103d_632 [Sinorhizobium fredii HH103]
MAVLLKDPALAASPLLFPPRGIRFRKAREAAYTDGWARSSHDWILSI